MPGSIWQWFYLGLRPFKMVKCFKEFQNAGCVKLRPEYNHKGIIAFFIKIVTMKRPILILILSIIIGFPFVSAAQDGASWKITLNKKVILNSNNYDDTITNTLKIKRSDLDNNALFKIDFIDPAKKATKGTSFRTIAFLSPAQTVVLQKDSSDQVLIYNRDLLKVIWANKKVTLCTWSTPLDPGIAAAIRIRRFRLCTLEFLEE